MIIVGDIHGELELVKKIISKYTNERFCWLGDYFDSFNRTKNEQKEAFNLIMARPDTDVRLLGNHDVHYLSLSIAVRGSGFSKNKFYDFNKLLIKDIKKFKYIHKEDDFYITHGGLNDWYIEQTHFHNHGVDLEEELNSKVGYINVNDVFHCIGHVRGGDCPYGGPLWCDWGELIRSNSKIIPKQIVGHSQRFCENDGYAKYVIDDVEFYNIDGLQSKNPSVIRLEDNKITIEKI